MSVERGPHKDEPDHLSKLAAKHISTDELVGLYTGYRELLDSKGQDVPTQGGWLFRILTGLPKFIRRFHQALEIENKKLPMHVWYEDFHLLGKAIVINIAGVESQGKRVNLVLTPTGPRWRHPDVGAWYDLSRTERPTQVELNPFKQALELLKNR